MWGGGREGGRRAGAAGACMRTGQVWGVPGEGMGAMGNTSRASPCSSPASFRDMDAWDSSKMRPWWICVHAQAYTHGGPSHVAVQHVAAQLPCCHTPHVSSLHSTQLHTAGPLCSRADALW